MKKTLYAVVLFLTIGIATTSCTKEDKPKTKTENPAKATIDAKSVVDTSYIFGLSSFEFGNKFYSSRNGNITKLGCKMPQTGNYRISLWNFSTQDLIAATTVAITDTSKFTYNSVSPIAITSNVRYVISLNNTSSGTPKQYTSGSITYEDFREKSSTTSTFPSLTLSNWAIVGVPDLQFEYTE